MKHKLDRETGHIQTILEDGELRCQRCEDNVVKEDYTCQCSVCDKYVCSECSATKDDETLVCVDCLEYLCSLPEELKKIKAGIEEIEKVSDELRNASAAGGLLEKALSPFEVGLRAGRISGTCKVMLHRLKGLKQ